MNKRTPLRYLAALAVGVGLLALVWTAAAAPTQQNTLAACADIGFSTEEDFLSRGPRPPDGNPVISDGDLLSPRGVVCARNRQLLAAFSPAGVPPLPDLGLDAVDIVTIEPARIAFSTELDDPFGRFKAGDLLTTDGAVIPNVALLAAFGVRHDLGLDAVHFIGKVEDITRFLEIARQRTRDEWLQSPGALPSSLKEFKLDLWFSTEGKATTPDGRILQDGDLLSAATGAIVFRQEDLLAPPIPAGLPSRGVDFGLDAVPGCSGGRTTVQFSTEIGYQDAMTPTRRFTGGDLLVLGGAVVMRNKELVNAFEPLVSDLGLDAITFPSRRAPCGEAQIRTYLPVLLKQAPR
ncbi:MAG: hypothetical protein M5U01_31310 [Ardenticatenaceae bacterium]|nr:hypothetical protein [Ardenticatenaceae bacterium]HBY95960.1 hypothetical protein [Chloroflexota bacterium]